MVDTIEHGTPEWHEARYNTVSGTDIGAVLGVNQYRSRLDTFMSKTVGGQPFVQNEAMKWGTLLEPVVAQEWAKEMGLDMEPGRFVQQDWRSGSPDFLVKGKKWSLEVKTAGYTQLKNYKDGRCPLSYEYQCRWYMALLDYEKWFLTALVGGQKQFNFIFIRDMRIEKMMLEHGQEFWNEVLEWRKNHPKGQ